jgi:hypothetical protein
MQTIHHTTMRDIQLDVILAKQSYREMLHQFLMKQHDTDTFEFLVAFQNQTLTPEELVKTFIQVNSKKELNIGTTLRRQLSQSCLDNTASITYPMLRPIVLQTKIEFNDGPYRRFKTTSDYKYLLTLHYDKNHTERKLASKDVSEWNCIEVYLFLYWNQMDYILSMDKLLGRIEKVDGAELYSFVDQLREDPDPERIRHIPMIHLDRLMNLADGSFYDGILGTSVSSSASSSLSSCSSSPSSVSLLSSSFAGSYFSRKTSTCSKSTTSFTTVNRSVIIECHYNDKSTAVEIKEKSLDVDNMLDELIATIACAFNCSPGELKSLKLIIIDDEGDRVTIRNHSDVKYLFTQRNTIHAEFVPLDLY